MPKLKKNLISLGALESNDFKVSMEAGVLKVTRGVLVFMKGLEGIICITYEGKLL